MPKVLGMSIVSILVVMVIGMYLQINYPGNVISKYSAAKLPVV